MKNKDLFKAILAFTIASAFIMPGVAAFANNEKPVKDKLNDANTESRDFDFTHTVFAEFATATTCGYCKYSHAALKTIYASGDYPFYYVSLICNKNSKAGN